jgi:hypothetical protein
MSVIDSRRANGYDTRGITSWNHNRYSPSQP